MTKYFIMTRDRTEHTVTSTCPLLAIKVACERDGIKTTDILIVRTEQTRTPTCPTNQKV